MTLFDTIKDMNIDDFAEWLDKNSSYDDSSWVNWFDKNYCKKCDYEIIHPVDNPEHDIKVAYCEINDHCRFFKDDACIPRDIDIIKMWLQEEV